MTTLNTPPSTTDLPGMQQRLTARLTRLGARVRAQIALDALVRSLAVVLGLLTLSLVLDWWLELSRPMRAAYWLVTLAGGAHYLYHYGVKPLRRRLGPVELAEAVDVARGHTGQQQLAPRVATVLQLPAMFGDDDALSGQMIRDAVGRSYRSLEKTDFAAALNSRHVMQCLGALLATLLVPGVVGAVMENVGEDVVDTWAHRWLMFDDTPYPRNTAIAVRGLNDEGELIVPAGENFTLRTTITNKDQTEVNEPRISLSPGGGGDWPKGLEKFAAGDFRLDMSPLNDPARATIRAGDQSLTVNIVPAARPRLTGLKITHRHPANPESAQTIDFDGAEGEIALLELTRVELRLTANVKIAEARYVEDQAEGAPTPQRPEIERVSDNTFVIRWEHNARQRFRLELVSEGAGLVSQPIPVSVGLKTDRKPSVRVRSSGVGQRVTPNALIPLTEVKATDDYGLTDLSLAVVRERSGGDDAGPMNFDPVVLYKDDQARLKDLIRQHNLEVSDFDVRPTDVLRITGVATDNRYTGAQVGESTTLTFRIVTAKELTREIRAQQQQARAAFRQAMEDSKDIQADLLAATSGAQAAAQARKAQAIMRNVWKVSNSLSRSAEEMRLNRIAAFEDETGSAAFDTMKRDILDPLARLHSDTMKTQLRALQNAGAATPEQLAKLASDQAGIVKDMRDLLLKMESWDELMDAINQLTEVIGQQQQLKDKIEELINQQFDDLFD